MEIDRENPLPCYAQVEETIAEAIVAGAYSVGSQLPPETVLIERFGVSRVTVRKAVENLVAKGLVEIRRGKGTFVIARRIDHSLNALTGFVEDMEAIGRKATAKLIDWAIVAADNAVSRNLRLEVGVDVVRVHRVRIADGIPISFDETYLPVDLGKKIVSHNLDVEPIFKLLEDRYDTPLVEAEYHLAAVAADPAAAVALELRPDAPIFLIERTSFTQDGKPVDYERLHYRGDLVRFTTRLRRRRTLGER
jgi:GntR family transcriptional regulator